LLEERGIARKIRNFDQFWADFHTYIRLLHATGRTREEILSAAYPVLNYDFPAWLTDEEPGDPEEYRLAGPTEFAFALSEEGYREMDGSLAVWTTHIRGLSKLVTRIKVDAQIRVCRPARPEQNPAEALIAATPAGQGDVLGTVRGS
jgi:hypothetical protein